jgi:hypothetical protein
VRRNELCGHERYRSCSHDLSVGIQRVFRDRPLVGDASQSCLRDRQVGDCPDSRSFSGAACRAETVGSASHTPMWRPHLRGADPNSVPRKTSASCRPLRAESTPVLPTGARDVLMPRGGGALPVRVRKGACPAGPCRGVGGMSGYRTSTELSSGRQSGTVPGS